MRIGTGHTTTKKTLLVAEAKKVQRLGFPAVPIIVGEEKKPPSWFSWTDLRDGTRPALSDEEIENMFSSPEVGRVGILLNNRCFLIDYDGHLGKYMLWNELMPRFAKELQRALRSTAHTKTPHGGHILVLLHADAFPEGIEEMLCWQLLNNGHVAGDENGNGHAEIRILSQSKYSIEYGHGYEPIVDIQQVVTLSKEASIELVEVCRRFKLESMVIRNVASGISPYWVKERRQDLALAIPGYLHKNQIDIDVAKHLIRYLTQVTGDEEAPKRLDAVNSTYSKEAKEVSGYTRLMELIDENDSIIQKIEQQFSKLGYDFYDGNGKASKSQSKQRQVKNDDEEKSVKLSAQVIELLRPRIGLLFKNQFNTPFAAIEINEHREIVQVHKSNRFNLWVRKTYYDEAEDTLSGDILKEVVETLESEALFDGPLKTLDLRISKDPHDELTYWYDLCNEEWEAIKITKDGWQVLSSNEVPIMFRRYSGQQAQVYPSRSYPTDIMDQFIGLINLKGTVSTRLLVICYVISVLIPGIAKAMLMVHGPKGAAKTAFEDLVKELLDPSVLGNLTLPRNTEQLAQQLMHNFLVYYDNVSMIPEWLSNDLCRAVTGTANSKRQLYSDDDDVIYQYRRPVGFNGINLAASRSDALDRGLIIELERIKPENRRSFEGDIKPELERIKPGLLGFILDVIVEVLKLKARGGIKLESMSRRADFEIACEMISRCLGYDEGKFIEAYEENKELGTSQVLEGSSMARVIIQLMESNDRWSGSATELLSKLEEIAVELKINTQRDKAWPKAPNALSRRLNEIKSNLEDINIFIYTTEKDTKTKLKIFNLCKISSESSELSDGSKPRSDHSDSSADTEILPEISSEIPSDRTSKNHAQITSDKQVSGDSDGSDDILQHGGVIYRLGRMDQFGCEDCRMKGDKWFMQAHVCKGQNNNKKNEVKEATPPNELGNDLFEYDTIDGSEDSHPH